MVHTGQGDLIGAIADFGQTDFVLPLVGERKAFLGSIVKGGHGVCAGVANREGNGAMILGLNRFIEFNGRGSAVEITDVLVGQIGRSRCFAGK